MLNAVSPYVAKFPKFEPVGNYFVDETLKTNHFQAQIMITGMAQVQDVVPMLFSKYQEVTTALIQTSLEACGTFDPVPRAFGNRPDDWVCGFVLTKIDLTAPDCDDMLVVDPKSVHKLFLGMVQLGAKHSMEGDILHRGVCFFLCNTQCEDVEAGSTQSRRMRISLNKVLLACGMEVLI